MTRLHEERKIIALCIATDLVLYWLALTLATLSRLDVIGWIDFSELSRDRFACIVIFGAVATIAGAYKPQRLTDRFDSVYYALIALAWACLLQLMLTALLPADLRQITRREIIITACLGAALLCAWRFFAPKALSHFPSLYRHFYVVGTPALGARIANEITGGDESARARAEYIAIETLAEYVEKRRLESPSNGIPISDAIIALDREDHWQLDGLLLFCREHCRRTYLYPSVHDLLLLQQRNLAAVSGIPLIEVASQQVITPYTYIKRLIDIAAAVGGLIASFPICLVTAIAVKMSSPGGIFYSQERLGMGGKPFRVYKFRSMRADIELKNESGHVLAQENDPRITTVGNFIRKHRIDELPQFFNVLRGDMSLIGPRPAWREFYTVNGERMPLLEQRLAVRPGLTCLSHVLGSYESEPADRLMYDLLYISSLSFLTDFRIMVGTVRIVLSGKGAR